MTPKLRQKNMCMNNNKATRIGKMESRERKGGTSEKSRRRALSGEAAGLLRVHETVMRVLAVFNILESPLFSLLAHRGTCDLKLTGVPLHAPAP